MYVCIYVCTSLFICKYTMFDTVTGLLGLFPERLSVTGINHHAWPGKWGFIGRCRHQHRKHTGVWAGNPARAQEHAWRPSVPTQRFTHAPTHTIHTHTLAHTQQHTHKETHVLFYKAVGEIGGSLSATAGVTSVRLINAEYICRSGKLFLTSENIWTLWSRNRSGEPGNSWKASEIDLPSVALDWPADDFVERSVNLLCLSFQTCDVRERGGWCLFHAFRF